MKETTTKKTGAAPRRRRKTHSRSRRQPASLLDRGALAVRSGVSSEVSAMQNEIVNLVHDLQDRLHKLNSIGKRGAAHAGDGIQEFITDTLSNFTGKAVSDLTDRVQSRALSLSNEAARVGTRTMKKVTREAVRRPLLTLAIAAGVGFLAGLARRD